MDVDDIVKSVPDHHRTFREWELLGRHHGDACVARTLRELPKREWFGYLRAVREGIGHLFVIGAPPKSGYYLGYLAQVELYLYSAKNRRTQFSGLREVA